MGFEFDDIDRGILHRLQDDARHTTATDIAGEVGVTANTVRNRIDRLEEAGVITGYVPLLEYERTERPMRVVVECTAPVDERETLAEAALETGGVVLVRELVTGRGNLRIDVVAADTDEITATVSQLAAHGLEIEREELVKTEYRQPFDHFGTTETSS
ncbi:Lrp/AsnC family transcriptional regulator [Natronolimnohabitans innermongolicus]|uniref:AsnC family transcriptional regulator n=1 Tax=Natronolimnohabitans innermongolicus JCM 12255 TaxID=1227499 RepID=L9XBW3_9EURY|nr:Lrp/AsnC family transcriptional regulator [Natronolimnohabitans innermongolicus]ELY58926.1 AsnC family transcriptional regulator [Natronolimnohabitans innermongolicus JCM 12255]